MNACASAWRVRAAATVLLLAVGATMASAQAPATLTADGIVALVLNARKTSGFRAYAKLTRETDGSHDPITTQLLIKGRCDGERTTVLYQVLSPKEVAGTALVIKDAGDHKTTGFLHESGQTVPLTPQRLRDRFLDSDLSIEDLAEEFWHWPTRELVGEDRIYNWPTVIVEFRPGPDSTSAYARVKVWVSVERALPLRVQQFGPNGTRVKEINAGRVVLRDKRWFPATMTVERVGQPGRTHLEGSKSEQNLELSADEFTPEAIERGLRPPP